METYNPDRSLNPSTWLALDEAKRIKLVQNYHENIEHELTDDALNAHCSLHVIVENQLTMEVKYVPETIAKLIQQGLERHEAINAIEAIILGVLLAILKDDIKEFSPSKYKRKLQQKDGSRGSVRISNIASRTGLN